MTEDLSIFHVVAKKLSGKTHTGCSNEIDTLQKYSLANSRDVVCSSYWYVLYPWHLRSQGKKNFQNRSCIHGENDISRGRVIFFPRGNCRNGMQYWRIVDSEELEMRIFLCQDGWNYQQESWNHYPDQTRAISGEPSPPCQSLPAFLVQKPPMNE